jgi:hypothetical protein
MMTEAAGFSERNYFRGLSKDQRAAKGQTKTQKYKLSMGYIGGLSCIKITDRETVFMTRVLSLCCLKYQDLYLLVRCVNPHRSKNSFTTLYTDHAIVRHTPDVFSAGNTFKVKTIRSGINLLRLRSLEYFVL